MKLLDWQPFTENEIRDFVKTSTPKESDLMLEKIEADAGWVDFYFKENNKSFKVTDSLATDNLVGIVQFFEYLINLECEVAIVLDDEIIS